MNKAIFIFSVAVAASGGYWSGKNHHSPDATVPLVAFVESESITPLVAAQLSEIHIENSFQYEDALADKNEPLFMPEQAVAVDQATQHQIDAIKTEYEFKQRSESFNNWLINSQKTHSWFDLGIAMRERFDAEEIDHDWASLEEGRLQSFFTQEQALAGIAVKSTSCKSTQCKITISVMNHDHNDETTIAVTQVLSAEKYSHIIIDSQVQQGETVFYVSNNEKGFELN